MLHDDKFSHDGNNAEFSPHMFYMRHMYCTHVPDTCECEGHTYCTGIIISAKQDCTGRHCRWLQAHVRPTAHFEFQEKSIQVQTRKNSSKAVLAQLLRRQGLALVQATCLSMHACKQFTLPPRYDMIGQKHRCMRRLVRAHADEHHAE